MPTIRCSAAIVLLSLLPGVAFAKVLPFELKTTRLDNGLVLVMVPYPSPGLVAYDTLVRVGSRDEVEKGVTGFAHFFEHMMFRGTDRFPPTAVDALLRKTGADQNGFTTDDFTCYTFFGGNGQLEELVTYEADRLANLKYTEDVFKTEAKAVLGEYNKSASDPYLKLSERVRELTFKTHTYGHTTLGYLADIEAMPDRYAYSKTFFERFYTPDNTVVIAVGDFDPARLVALVKEQYGPLSRKRAPTVVKAEPPQTAEARGKIAWPTPTVPVLSMSWRVPAARFDSVDGAVLDVLFDLLFGRSSPLYRELVLEKQLVEGFSNDGWPHRDPYLFHVLAKVKEARSVAAVETRIGKAISDIAAGHVGAKLLADVRSHVRYSTLLGFETPAEIAESLAFAIGPSGDVDALEKRLALLDRVSTKDVQNFTKQYLTAKNRAVVVVEQESAR